MPELYWRREHWSSTWTFILHKHVFAPPKEHLWVAWKCPKLWMKPAGRQPSTVKLGLWVFLRAFRTFAVEPTWVFFVFFSQDGIIVENMHDVPYSFSLGPEVVACMTAVCCGVRRVCPSLPLGVQILSAANQQALAVALASGSVILHRDDAASSLEENTLFF